MKTKVIFRWWKNDVIALFPDETGTEPHLCMSYQHIGQHGDAWYDIIVNQSRPATEIEYRNLLRELICIGYDLKIIKRKYNKK